MKMKWFIITTLFMIMHSTFGEYIYSVNITPEEAQNLDLRYAPKLGERALRVKRYPNPNEYTYHQYPTNQFHGQDGLGRYVFGHSDRNQARVEGRNINGDVHGAYKFTDANGNDFIANYWADSTGFHQEDNTPKIVTKPAAYTPAAYTPAEYTPAVKAGREEHFRRWNEIANDHRNYGQQLERASAKQYKESREEHFRKWNEIANDHSNAHRNANNNNQQRSQSEEASEKQYAPRGFFYSFDNPVQVARNLNQ